MTRTDLVDRLIAELPRRPHVFALGADAAGMLAWLAIRAPRRDILGLPS